MIGHTRTAKQFTGGSSKLSTKHKTNSIEVEKFNLRKLGDNTQHKVPIDFNPKFKQSANDWDTQFTDRNRSMGSILSTMQNHPIEQKK